VIGTVLVAAGAVLIALFGAMSEPSHNLDQLLALLGHSQFIMWISGTFFLVGCILFAVWSQEHITMSLPSRLTLSLSSSLPTIRLNAPPQTRRLLNGLAYGAISGVLSAHCLLLAKSAVELLVRSIFDQINQFDRWQSWIILLGLIGLALAQLYFLHRGLKICSTSVLYPFVFCVYNIVAILDGLIYFRQASRIKTSHAVLVTVGAVILMAGVFALSWRLDPEYDPEGGKPVVSMTSAPVSPVDGKQPVLTGAARVQTPGSALTPGLGLVEHENLANLSHEDEESDALMMMGRGRQLLRNRPATPNEITPLLRTQTEPALTGTPGKHRASKSAVDFRLPHSPDSPRTPFGSSRQQLRNPRVRRTMTTNSPNASRLSLDMADEAEQSGLWDELANDAGSQARRFSTQAAKSPTLNHSNSASKIGALRRARRGSRTSSGVWGSIVERAGHAGGTLKGGLKGLGIDVNGWKTSGYGTLNHVGVPDTAAEADEGQDIEANQEGTVRRYPLRNSTGRGHAEAAANGPAPSWLRTDKWEWWKRPWRRSESNAGEEHE
jgi:hypothetical protein